ncbi:MAG: hypothetical protein K2G63_00195 [Oscillospiraceae bacterium]|nr:hypothetical protein [Oscillospiraceae bacterium]
MKKFTLVALGISAALLAVTAIAKLLKKKCPCNTYDEDEFEDWKEDDYCFDDCNCDDSDIGSIIPPEDSEEVAEVPDVDVKVTEEDAEDIAKEIKESVEEDIVAEKTEE